MTDNRCVISLDVNAEDDVEIPENPYAFVMFPILDNAVGDGRFPGGETDGGQMGMEKSFYKLVDILDGIRRGTNIHRQNGTDVERRMIVWN